MKKINYVVRQEIERLLKEGKSPIEIARILGYGTTTIYKELRRCGERGNYSADAANLNCNPRLADKSNNISGIKKETLDEIIKHQNKIMKKIETLDKYLREFHAKN